MAITITNLIDATGSSVDATSYVTASKDFVAGRVYIVGICNSRGSAAPLPSSVATTGGDITFANITFANAFGASYKISLWVALAATSVTDTVTIGFGASTQTGCSWEVLELTGAAATQPQDNAGSGGVGSSPAAATLGTNIIPGNARVSLAAVDSTTPTLTVSSGTWTSGTMNSHSSPSLGLRMAWDATPATTDTSASWSFSGSHGAAALIMEVGAATATGQTEYVGVIPI